MNERQRKVARISVFCAAGTAMIAFAIGTLAGVAVPDGWAAWRVGLLFIAIGECGVLLVTVCAFFEW